MWETERKQKNWSTCCWKRQTVFFSASGRKSSQQRNVTGEMAIDITKNTGRMASPPLKAHIFPISSNNHILTMTPLQPHEISSARPQQQMFQNSLGEAESAGGCFSLIISDLNVFNNHTNLISTLMKPSPSPLEKC